MLTTLLFALHAARAGTLTIDGADGARAFTCEEGQDVVIRGADLEVTLAGACGEVRVIGSANVVTVDGVRRIVVEGSANEVTWARNLSGKRALPVSTVGVRNRIRGGR